MSSEYKIWKEQVDGKSGFRVDCGDRVVGRTSSKVGAELLIATDEVEEKMCSAPQESRKRPTMFKGVAID